MQSGKRKTARQGQALGNGECNGDRLCVERDMEFSMEVKWKTFRPHFVSHSAVLTRLHLSLSVAGVGSTPRPPGDMLYKQFDKFD